MRIAFILPTLANTGPGIVVKELAQGLVKLGHRCSVFYFDDFVELEMPCQTYRISFWRSIDFAEWDVVHSNMIRPDLYVRLHTLWRKVKPLLITTLHNPISFSALNKQYNCLQSLLGSSVWKIALPAFRFVVVLNSYIYTHIKGVERDKLVVVFNGKDILPSMQGCERVDVEAIMNLKEKYTIVGTISRLIPRKGLEQMINALPYLPKVAFVAVGDGSDLEKLKNLASENGVADRCYWTGYRKERASDYHSLFDIFIMCSRSEGFPLALIEAAGHAKPTILSDIPILTSLITSKEVVFYNLDNIQSLVDKLQYLIEHRAEYSKEIYRYYQRELTAETMVKRYLALYSNQG